VGDRAEIDDGHAAVRRGAHGRRIEQVMRGRVRDVETGDRVAQRLQVLDEPASDLAAMTGDENLPTKSRNSTTRIGRLANDQNCTAAAQSHLNCADRAS